MRISQELKFSVIICTLSRPELVRRVLTSICSQSRQPEQIIVVDASDNNSTGKVCKEIADQFAGRLEYYHAEKGLTKQRNFGIEKANGDIIGFFDDDVVLDRTYLQEICRVFSNDTAGTIGGATGYIYSSSSLSRQSIIKRCLWKFRDSLCEVRYLYKYYNILAMPDESFEEDIELKHVSGCNMFFRREIFQHLKFDLWYEGYGLGEDRDFGLRVSKRWRIIGVGRARLHHLVERSSRPNRYKFGQMMIENPLRILVLARSEHIRYYFWALAFRQLLSVFIGSVGLIFSGEPSEGVAYLKGGFSGMKKGIKFIHGHMAQRDKMENKN